jgi:hypothetical protein
MLVSHLCHALLRTRLSLSPLSLPLSSSLSAVSPLTRRRYLRLERLVVRLESRVGRRAGRRTHPLRLQSEPPALVARAALYRYVGNE